MEQTLQNRGRSQSVRPMRQRIASHSERADYQRQLAQQRAREAREARLQMVAAAPNNSLDHGREQIAAFDAEIQRIKTSKGRLWHIFGLLIFATLFTQILAIINVIPVVGWGFYIAIKLCNMILGIMIISYANSTSHVKSHGRLYGRFLLILFTGLLGIFFPLIDMIIPAAIFAELIVYYLARKDHDHAIADLMKKRGSASAFLA